MLMTSNVYASFLIGINDCLQKYLMFSVILAADMIFVKNFTQPDFQSKNFTQQKCLICDIFLAN